MQTIVPLFIGFAFHSAVLAVGLGENYDKKKDFKKNPKYVCDFIYSNITEC